MSQPPTVLIVDDDPSHLKLYSWIVERAGFKSAVALVGSTRVVYPETRDIDIIALDYRLASTLNAPEIAVELNHLYPGVPIIVLSELTWLPASPLKANPSNSWSLSPSSQGILSPPASPDFHHLWSELLLPSSHRIVQALCRLNDNLGGSKIGMKRTITVLGLLAVLSLFCAAQSQYSAGTSHSGVQITNGPGVDNLTTNSAVIFWNTNVPTGAIVRYGTSQDKLSQTAQVSSGETDHKAQLSNLQPSTIYFFQVEATQGNVGAGAKSGIGTFKTKSKSGDDQKY